MQSTLGNRPHKSMKWACLFLSASSSLASLARASSNSADVTEDTVVVEVVVVEVVVEVVVGIPQLSLAMRNYWFLLWIV